MLYTATITSASLRLRESRVVASLLIDGVDDEGWKAAIEQDNALQMDSLVSIRGISGLLRARLEPLGAGLWDMVANAERDLATQAVFAAAVHNSRLLGDFMDLALREQRALFATELQNRVWADYIEGCRGRDPEMPQWSDITIAKLRSATFTMLAEAGYLQDTKSLKIQTVFVDIGLAAYLRGRGENYVLRCMQVTE